MTIFTNVRAINLLLLIFLGLFLVVVGFFNYSTIMAFLSGSEKAVVQNGQSDVEEKSQLRDNAVEDAGINGGKGVLPTTAGAQGEQEVNMEDAALQNGQQTQPENNDFFVEYRMERERVRGRQVELLEGIINNPDSTDDMRREAQQRLMQVTENMERELHLENLIKAKGYSEAALFIQPGSATVILKKASISEQDATRIADLVSRVTGYDLNDIVIIPK